MAKLQADHATLTSYAQALLELSDTRGVTDQVAGDVKEIAGIIAASPMLGQYFNDPSISHVERSEKLDRVFNGKVADVLLGFLKLLNAKGRLGDFAGIAEAFRKLLDARAGNQDVEVTVAERLSDAELENVRVEISKKIGKHANVTQKVDDSIIGGLILKIGDKLVDGSVRSQLQSMRQQLRSATVAS